MKCWLKFPSALSQELWNYVFNFNTLSYGISGKNEWNLNNFFQNCLFEESQASEAKKIDYSKNEAIKFWLKNIYKTCLIFWHCLNMVAKRPSLERNNSQKSTFSKFRFRAEFHIFSWNENKIFCWKNKRLVFMTSEARLSLITQYWKKLFKFHSFLPKGLSNFVYLVLKFHALKYHTPRPLDICYKIRNDSQN